MTYTGAEFSTKDLLRELVEKSLREKISSFEEYMQLVDNLVEEKRGYGFFNDDEDLVQVRYDLEMAWPTVKEILDENATSINE